jgi:hypothetical protein
VAGTISASPPWEVEMHRLTVTLLEMSPVTAPGSPAKARVRIQNLTTRKIGGEVTIGGPTGDIDPLGAVAQPFAADPGQSVEVTLEFTFAATAVRGDYPVHAFVQIKDGGDGTLEVARTIRVDFPTAAREIASEGAAPTLAELPNPPELAGLNGLLEQWRLEALGDYVRTEKKPVEGSIFPLGTGKDAFRVAVIPGDNGLLDGWILFIGPEQRIHFHGLHLELRLPAGVLESSDEPRLQPGPVKPVTIPDGIGFDHFLSCGQWSTKVRVEVTASDGALRFRATSPDEIVSFGLGSSNRSPSAVIGGNGERITIPAEGWTAESAPDFFRAPAAGFEFGPGLNLLVRSTAGFHRLIVDSKTKQTRIEVSGEEGFSLTPGIEPLHELLFRSEHGSDAVAAGMQRLWLDVQADDLRATKDLLVELVRYDAGPKSVILRHQGEPSGESAGVLQDFAVFAKAAGLVWGLDSNGSQLSPLHRNFDFDPIAFHPDGTPMSGAPGRYLLRPDSLQPFLDSNAKSVRGLVRLGIGVLGEVDELSHGFHDRSGAWHTAGQARLAWIGAMESTRESLGKGSAVLVRSGGEWLPSNADGVLLPRAEPAESGLPAPWAASGRPAKLRNRSEGGPKEDLLGLLHGDLVLATHREWGREMVRRAWFLLPVANQLAAVPAVKLSPHEGNYERLQWTKGEDITLWSNWSAQPWEVEGTPIAPYGFQLQSKNLSGGLRLINGRSCEILQSPGVWYVNAAPQAARASAKALGCRFELDDAGVAHATVEWECSAGRPYGTKATLLGYEPEDPMRIAFQTDLPAADSSSGWKGRITSRCSFDLRELPIADFNVALVLGTPGGRPLRFSGPALEERGRYAGFAVKLGRLKIERIEEGHVQEIAFVAEPVSPDLGEPVAQPIQPKELIDTGWARTNGGFRLERFPEGFRLIPLPDSGAFDVILKPEALGFRLEDVQGLISRDLYGAGWERREPPVVDGELRWTHEPKVFAYDLILK